jgi:hypothetical protein
MLAPGNEQIDGKSQEEDLNNPQGSFPAEDRGFTKHVGIVDKGDERHQRHDIVKQSVKAEAEAEFLFCEICHRYGDQGAVKSTPQNPTQDGVDIFY